MKGYIIGVTGVDVGKGSESGVSFKGGTKVDVLRSHSRFQGLNAERIVDSFDIFSCRVW